VVAKGSSSCRLTGKGDFYFAKGSYTPERYVCQILLRGCEKRANLSPYFVLQIWVVKGQLDDFFQRSLTTRI
jgi:hypothetical protein